MWPVGNNYFTARYWVTDYWFDAAVIVAATDWYIGTVLSPGDTGQVRTAGDVS